MIEHIETYLRVVIAGAAVAVITNIQTLLIVVFILTFLNWLVGLFAGIKEGEKYSHKKTFKAFREMYTALAILFFTALVCNLLEPDVDYKMLIQGITVIFTVVYAKNISKNLKVLQPSNMFVAMLDKIVNVKFKKMHKRIDDEITDITEITKD